MEKQELEKRFEDRYADIIESRDEQKMERLGAMVKRMIHWMTKNVPEVAEQAIAMLDDEDGKTNTNYLTKEEARDIVEDMDPQPAWSMNRLAATLEQMKMRLDDAPHYNRWALLTTMLMIQSDSGPTLSHFMNTSKESERMVTIIYQLALDRLKDLDGKFNIRKYFDLPPAAEQE